MNPYEVLGVDPSISDEELSSAYKKLAKKYHPDLNPGNESAARKMGEVNQAYDQIKAMRQRGQSYETAGANAYSCAYSSYGAERDPFAEMWRNVHYTYRRRSPVGRVLAVLVALLLARLVIQLLFGGYARNNMYYSSVPGMSPYGYYDYGGYDTITP